MELDILTYCRRALGEFASIHIQQGRLGKVVKDIPLHPSQPQNPLVVRGALNCLPFNPATIPEDKLREMKVTVIHTVDTHFVPPEVDTPYDPAVPASAVRIHPDYHHELNIFSLDSFVMDHFPSPIAAADVPSTDTTLIFEDTPEFSRGLLDLSVLAMRKETRADYFWAQHLVERSPDIVLGIYNSVFNVPEGKNLKERGYTYWRFPNGEKIPLDQLTIGVVEVIPDTNYAVLTRRFDASEFRGADGQSLRGRFHSMKEHWKECSNLLKGVAQCHCTAVTEEGIVQTHCFLQAKLPSSGETYVVDPVARGLNYRPAGKKGQLIVHSSWEAWKANFPGKVIGKYTLKRPNLKATVQDEGPKRAPLLLNQLDTYFAPKGNWSLFDILYHLGNGPKSENITRLSRNLIKYLDREICGYCGRVEGLHPEPALPNKITRRPREAVRMYSYKGVELKACGRCGKVKYCGTFCQKLDWPQHKLICQKKE